MKRQERKFVELPGRFGENFENITSNSPENFEEIHQNF